MTRSPDFTLISSELLKFIGDRADKITIGVSGGPDSMALCHFLAENSQEIGLKEVHAVIIDHGLRENSAEEATTVQKALEDVPNVRPFIYTIDNIKKDSRLQEQARHKRYEILKQHCRDNEIEYLVTAHHQDDQGETVLFRLARGSGLDGLAAMNIKVRLDEDLWLLRPFLNIPKQNILNYCNKHQLPYVRDPSNQNENFSRPRLRAAREVLEKEGLTSKRLATTASRLRRARQALEYYTSQAIEDTLLKNEAGSFIYSYSGLKDHPAEVRLRVLIQTIGRIHPDDDYGPRFEKLEDLENDLFGSDLFKTRTLGKCIFSRNVKEDQLTIKKE